MRASWVVVLVACSSSTPPSDGPRHDAQGVRDSHIDADPAAACGDGGSADHCYCDGTTWHCTTCPFGEGSDAQSCAGVGFGATCVVENWEHGCDCTCNERADWACSPETLNSICPVAPDAPPLYDAPT